MKKKKKGFRHPSSQTHAEDGQQKHTNHRTTLLPTRVPPQADKCRWAALRIAVLVDIAELRAELCRAAQRTSGPTYQYRRAQPNTSLSYLLYSPPQPKVTHKIKINTHPISKYTYIFFFYDSHFKPTHSLNFAYSRYDCLPGIVAVRVVCSQYYQQRERENNPAAYSVQETRPLQHMGLRLGRWPDTWMSNVGYIRTAVHATQLPSHAEQEHEGEHGPSYAQ